MENDIDDLTPIDKCSSESSCFLPMESNKKNRHEKKRSNTIIPPPLKRSNTIISPLSAGEIGGSLWATIKSP